MVTARQITNGRRFGNATLDSLLGKLLAFYPLTESDLVFLNYAPQGHGTPLYGQESTGITAGASGAVFGDTGDYASSHQPGLISPVSDAPFTLSLQYTPTDATPAAARVLLSYTPSGSTAGFGIDNNTSGGVSLYMNGSYRVTGGASLSDGVESNITITRRNDSGTMTTHVFVDGVSQGSSTAGGAGLLSALLSLGRFGTNAANMNPGTMRNLSVWAHGMSDAEVAALDSNPALEGAGL